MSGQTNEPVDYEIAERWQHGIDAVRNEPVPAFDTGEMIDSVLPITKAIRPIRRISFVRIGLGTLAASVLLLLAVSLLRPVDAMAQVIEAVRSKPWVRMQTITSDGEKAGPTSWYSESKGVHAWTNNSGAEFINVRQRRRSMYRTGSPTIVELPVINKLSGQTLGTISSLFLEGDLRTGKIFSGFILTRVEAKPASGNSMRSIEFDGTDTRSGTMRWSVSGKLLIDPQTQLPFEMVMQHASANRPDRVFAPVRTKIDYPQHGPADIFDLGVSRDLKVVNRLPDDQLRKAIDASFSGNKDFGDYTAYIGEKIGTPQFLVRAKGNQLRLDKCLATDRTESVDEESAKQWTDAEWKQRLEQFDIEPSFVCDGISQYHFKSRTTRRWLSKDPATATQPMDLSLPEQELEKLYERLPPRTTFGPAQVGRGDREVAMNSRYIRYYLPERLGYPQFGMSHNHETTMRPGVAGEPEGTVLVEIKTTEPPSLRTAWRLMRLWLDADKGYVAVREEYHGRTDYTGFGGERCPYFAYDTTNMIRECSDHKQTPNGHWYPTTVRLVDMKKKGEQETTDIVQHFYLDFKSEVADNVFTVSEEQLRYVKSSGSEGTPSR